MRAPRWRRVASAAFLILLGLGLVVVIDQSSLPTERQARLSILERFREIFRPSEHQGLRSLGKLQARRAAAAARTLWSLCRPWPWFDARRPMMADCVLNRSSSCSKRAVRVDGGSPSAYAPPFVPLPLRSHSRSAFTPRFQPLAQSRHECITARLDQDHRATTLARTTRCAC